MKRGYSVLLAAFFLFPFLTRADHVLIWNYDPLDKFYDSAVGDTIDCAYWLEQSLTGNGHTYEIETSLPANLNPYDVVLVTLGWYRC